MSLAVLVSDFASNPFPQWQNEITNQLVSQKQSTLSEPYSLTNSILRDKSILEDTISLSASPIKIVLPSALTHSFNVEHGLEPFPVGALFYQAVRCLEGALSIFTTVPSLKSFIDTIVSSIQILKTDDPEIDVSYSHPDIPFSIFVSASENCSIVYSLRVSEAILHEAMHLQLTLMENVAPMVVAGSSEIYYSPWRDSLRPVRGVLHGLYVFRAILDFYSVLLEQTSNEIKREYLHRRQTTIQAELITLSDFHTSPGLTPLGQKLAFRLLQTN